MVAWQRWPGRTYGNGSEVEAIVFIGIQGSGKSTLYRERFFDTHVRINLDMLRTRRRENLLLKACFDGGQRFVVDNTNPTREDREKYLTGARTAGFRTIAYYFDAEPVDALPRNEGRTGRARVPDKAIHATHRKLEPPSLDEGFDEIHIVRTAADGRFEVERLAPEHAEAPARSSNQQYTR